MAKSYDFVFYMSFMESIEQISKLYSKEEAETFCLELIRYGVRRERKVTMRPELEALMLSLCPYIDKSREHLKRTASRVNSMNSQARSNTNSNKKNGSSKC